MASQELRDLLGEDADAAIGWLGVTEQGNFVDPHHPEPGLNVLTRPRSPSRPGRTRERIRARLLAARETRTRPGLDDKRLTSWNALMITALADAGAVFDEPRYLDAAQQCAEFILRDLREPATAGSAEPAPGHELPATARPSRGDCCAPTPRATHRSAATWRTTPSCWRR